MTTNVKRGSTFERGQTEIECKKLMFDQENIAGTTLSGRKTIFHAFYDGKTSYSGHIMCKTVNAKLKIWCEDLMEQHYFIRVSMFDYERKCLCSGQRKSFSDDERKQLMSTS